MANLNENGLIIDNINTIQGNIVNGTDKTLGYKQIYGENINLDADTPDGQQIAIYSQGVYDQQLLLQSIYNMFSPEFAMGIQQDNLYPLNGIYRKIGTFTIQPIKITISQAVSLQGLDLNINSEDGTGYTISDNQNNKFILMESITLTVGTYLLNFRAEKLGEVHTKPNTINNQITVILGVVSVNNPSNALSLGYNSESDSQFRTRRRNSINIPAQGILWGLYSAILSLQAVINCYPWENDTDIIDSYGVFAHNIWIIVEGGDAVEIATLISKYKTNGIGMKGDEVVNVLAPNGLYQEIKFDRPKIQQFYIKFNAVGKSVGYIPDFEYIKQQLIINFSANMNQSLYSNDFICILNTIDNKTVFYNLLLSSDGENYSEQIAPTTPQFIFNLNINNIIIIK